MRKQRFCLKWPWALPEDLQVVCGQEWRSTCIAEVRLKALCVTECIRFCCMACHKIIVSPCSNLNRRLGEWKLLMRRFAADCLSLQSGCSPETHWAAARGLLAGQVNDRHLGLLGMLICAPVIFKNVINVVFCSVFYSWLLFCYFRYSHANNSSRNMRILF